MRRSARGAILVGLPGLASCGATSRNGFVRFLEALQRPFDLNGRTWLGVPAPLPAHFIVSATLAGLLAWLWGRKAAVVLLGFAILAKEGVDLTIIASYQPLTSANAVGSASDIVVSVLGAGLGLWMANRFTENASDRGGKAGAAPPGNAP